MCPSLLSDVNIYVQLIVSIKVCGTDGKKVDRYCKNIKFSITIAEFANDVPINENQTLLRV